MHGPVLIVAEREETDKKVCAEVGGFSLRNFASLREVVPAVIGLPLPLGEGWGEGAKLSGLRPAVLFPSPM